MKFRYRVSSAVIATAFLTGCGGLSQSPPVTSQISSGASSLYKSKRESSGCTVIKDSTGTTYTAAQTDGGYYSDVEYSSSPCQIGIYIGPSSSSKGLLYAAVNGPFAIGVYFDHAGKSASLSYGSICVHGSESNYDSCITGKSGQTTGTGLYVRDTPDVTVAYTEVDSYPAGVAVIPCPSNRDKLSIDYSTITNAVYAWSYANGRNQFFFDSPTPHRSCAGGKVGSGLTQ